jgi:hypothetical protein
MDLPTIMSLSLAVILIKNAYLEEVPETCIFLTLAFTTGLRVREAEPFVEHNIGKME